jgi:hypothetical protein
MISPTIGENDSRCGIKRYVSSGRIIGNKLLIPVLCRRTSHNNEVIGNFERELADNPTLRELVSSDEKFTKICNSGSLRGGQQR